MKYIVTFGKQNFDRDYESFKTLKEAKKFAEQKVKIGKEKVFIDTMDNDGDLVMYEQLN